MDLSPVEAEARHSKAAKQPDTPENFSEVWGRLSGPLIEEGLKYRMPAPPPSSNPPKIGFFFPAASMLAHAVNCRTLISAMAKIGSPYKPIVYALSGGHSEFVGTFPDSRMCGRNNALNSHLELRRCAHADRLSAMVFVSNPTGMAFASTIGVAPKHIWWSHKWHGLTLPYLDGYIDACHRFRDTVTLQGRVWPCVPTSLPEMFDPSKTAEAQKMRGMIPHKVVFGTLCREEKLTPEYAAVVARILDATPDSVFVYSGRQQQPWFEEAVGGDRAVYIGWVVTRLWAQIIDIFLDTFPFQSGHTAFEFMSASRPVVWMANDVYAEEQGVSETIEAAWQGIYPVNPVARSIPEYIETAVSFAADDAKRAQYGAAGRAFIDRHMRDDETFARRFVAEVEKIISASGEQRLTA